MKRFTFRGGTHLNEHKDTAALSTERLPEPASVSIPLSQHIGAPATPVVKVGDSVKIGQKLGEVAGGLGCPVHASVSGTVRAIVTRRNAMGTPVTNIVIENDGLRTMDDSMKPIAKPLAKATPEEIVEIVREAGISGLGGATFPTYAKIQSAMGKANLVIVNCAECEPYLTANHRLLLERGEIVISGMEIVMRALGVTEGILAVEDNKPDAIRLLEDRLKRREGLERGTNLRVCVLRTKYPQGDERQLVAALLGREIPAGKLPADVGCMILNAETAAAISRAYWRGLPLTSHRHGDGRLRAESEERPRPARRVGAGSHHLLRRTDQNAEEDDLGRTDDGLCALGSRNAGFQEYVGSASLLGGSRQAHNRPFTLHSLRQMRFALPHAPDAELPCGLRGGKGV